MKKYNFKRITYVNCILILILYAIVILKCFNTETEKVESDSGILKEAAKAKLGIRSPSKLSEEMGNRSAEEFEVGMASVDKSAFKVYKPKPKIEEVKEVETVSEEPEPEPEPEPEVEEVANKKDFYFNQNLSDNDKYLLAKMVMAEAEGESLETKMHIIMVILNRVDSKNFPNSIKEVLYEKTGNTYQFSPIGDGRFKKLEPNEDCWLALEKVLELEEDISKGALYFESCKGSSWHSRNLNYLFKSSKTRFYN